MSGILGLPMRGIIENLIFLKFSILKNSKIILFAIIWFLIFSYLSVFADFLPEKWLKLLAVLQEKYIPSKESWLIPFNILSLLVWIMVFILVKELVERISDYTKRGTLYRLTIQSWYKDWIYNGKTRFLQNPSRLRVNSSRAGCLLKKFLWKNFSMDFEIRFLDGYSRNIGIIFRAWDLENYFMLEVKIENNCLWVKPHVRYQGMWDTMSDDIILEFNDGEPPWLQEWLKVRLVVNGGAANLSIRDIEDYEWVLPSHVDINHIESGIRENNNLSSQQETNFGAKITYLPEIDFKNSFGMIGFRAHLNQGAEIKDLIIRSI